MSKKHKYDDEWIRAHFAVDPSPTHLWRLYNEEHGTDINKNTFVSYVKTGLRLKTGRKWKRFTEEETLFIKENYEKLTYDEFYALFEKTFGYKANRKWVSPYANYLGLHKPAEIKAQNTHDSNAHPIGSERKDGRYIKVKVKNGMNEAGNWKRKHQVIWEKEYGEVSEGCVVTFLDGDPSNLDISNLVCVSKEFLGYMSGCFKNRFETRETAELKFKWCELNYEIKEKN